MSQHSLFAFKFTKGETGTKRKLEEDESSSNKKQSVSSKNVGIEDLIKDDIEVCCDYL